MEKMRMESPDGVQLNIDKIASIFPQAVTETLVDGKPKKVVDFDKLRQLLSSDVLEGDEAYEFTWVGKRAAIAEANRPIRKTLRPCPDESKDWDTTQNLYIEGDNLEVLKLLQENYMGKVKMIYIDPPYNTGGDFIYKDDFSLTTEEFEEELGHFDENNNRLCRNPMSDGRFHSNWCSMMYSRLMLSRNLLSTDGVIFISLDNNEIDNLKKICSNIFGESNFIECISWNKRVPKNDNKGFGNIHEYILVYAKDSSLNRQFTMRKEGLEDVYRLLNEMKSHSVPIPKAEQELRKLYREGHYDRGITLYNSLNENYEPWGKINMSWPNTDTFGPRYEVIHPITKKPTKIPERGWRWNESTFLANVDYENVMPLHDGSYMAGNIWFSHDENMQPSSIKYLKDVDRMLLRSIISLKSDGGIELEHLFEGKSYFSYPKPTSLLIKLIDSLNEQEGIILDFFSGSATTAHAVMKQNAICQSKLQYIMVQLNEECAENSTAYSSGLKTICDIGKERIRRAGEAIKQEAGLAGQTLDIGFRVFKVDESNMEDIYYTPGETTQEKLREQKENIKGDRSALDLFFGCILDWGLPLSLPYTSEEIEGCTVHTYNDGDLVACFNEKIPESVVEAIAKRKPIRAVFRDSGFADSPAKINVGERFKLISPDTTVKVI